MWKMWKAEEFGMDAGDGSMELDEARQTTEGLMDQLPVVSGTPDEPRSERRHKTMTVKQVEANRRNGALSQGPRTADGKRQSAMNALKHGLTARTPVLPGEDPKEYEDLKLDMEVYWAP